MASGVTYQALDRLTYLPDRLAEDNGNVIAGQLYYNIYFTGGSINNCTINGIAYTPNVRVITASGTITGLPTDNVVVVAKTVGAATTLNLPASPGLHQIFTVKDGKGDANTNNITIQGNGNTIDSGSSYVIGSARGAIQLVWTGVEWSIIS